MPRTYFSEKNILDMDPTASASDIKEGMKVTGNGKGDIERPRQISAWQLARNWCRTFGHRLYDHMARCRDCGLTKEAIVEAGESIRQ